MPFANPFKRKKEKQASVKESSNQNLPPEKAAVQGNGNTQQQPEPVRPLVFHAQVFFCQNDYVNITVTAPSQS